MWPLRGGLIDVDDSYRYGPRSRTREAGIVKGFIWVSVGVAATCLLSLLAKDFYGVSPQQRQQNRAHVEQDAGVVVTRKFLKKPVSVTGGARFAEEATGILGVTATNLYSISSPVDTSVLPWDLLVEPYRDTTLTVQTSSDLDVTSSSTIVSWSITGPSTTTFTYSGVGASVVVQFTGVGTYTLVVTVTDTTSGATYSYTAYPMNKYVRREIRSLTEDDREAFLDALHTVYTVSAEDGVKLYGSSYHDIAWFVKKHLYGAADRECDHWHDDAGIVNHHVAYTLEMEQVLQAIEPSVSVPYWEYTIDSALDSWEDSQIFDDDWFGKASPDNEDHVVTTGRWAYTPIMSNASSFSRFYNPYGLLRSPWNTNPTPYFTRNHYLFGTDSFYWPSCQHFSDCYNSSSFGAMSLCLNGYTHGPVHIKIGGEWGMKDEDVSMAQDYNFLVPYLLLVKNLWRHGVVSCPSDCTSLGEDETCDCGLTDGVLEKKTAYQILTKYTGILHQMTAVGNPRIYWDADGDRYRVNGVSPEAEEMFWSTLLHTMSTPHHAGEMYTSAAPYDPTFWVIHPTAERLLNAKRISADLKGTAFDTTWSYDHVHKAASDSGQVCVWSDASSSSSSSEDGGDLPMCIKSLCDGHHEYDILPFQKFKADKSDLVYTNAMMLDYIHPFSDDLPYVYDNYRWDHCESTYPINI